MKKIVDPCNWVTQRRNIFKQIEIRYKKLEEKTKLKILLQV